MKTALESLDALEALARNMATYSKDNGDPHKAALWNTFSNHARSIVSELPPPVDPDLALARELVAEAQSIDAQGFEHAKRYRAGEWDTDTCIVKCVAALRQGREQGREEGRGGSDV